MKKLISTALALAFLMSTISISFATVGIMPSPKTLVLTPAGKLCVGCRICTYEPTSTNPKQTFTTAAGDVANPNPVVTDSNGLASVWYSGNLKVKVMSSAYSDCATGTALFTVDSIPAVESTEFSLNEFMDTVSTSWTYISANSFSVSGDRRSEYQVGRRLKATSVNVIYGRITSSSYSAPNTTVVVAWDSDSLDSGGITDMDISVASVTNPSLSWDMISGGTNTANITSNGTFTFAGPTNITGAATFSGGLTSSSTTTISGGGSITGSYAGNHTLSGVVTASGGLTSSGTTTVSGAANITGLATLSGGLNSSGTTTISGGGSISGTYSGAPTFSAGLISSGTMTGNATTATTATQVTDGTNNIRMKILDIGNWNMDTTPSVSVAHGLTYGKIRNAQASIRRDDDTFTNDLISGNSGSTGKSGAIYWDSTNINLIRITTEIFDAANYSSTSYNRGWITITYVE